MFAAPDMLMTPARTSVQLDAVGAGGTAFSTNASWSHTIAPGANVLAWVHSNGVNPTMTCGGSAMTLLGHIDTVYLFQISGVSGTKTMQYHVGTTDNMIGNSVSYLNVSSVGAISTGTGSSKSAVCSAGQMICQGVDFASGNFSTTSGGTLRYNGTGPGGNGLAILDSVVSTTFSATSSGGINFGWINTVLS